MKSIRCFAPERLEPRIAPAVIVSGDHRTATWTDVDGDAVTLKASKPVLDEADFTFLDLQPGDFGQQLARLNLTDLGAANQGVNLTFTAKRQDAALDGVKDGIKDGDGSVNVGRIDADGVDLGAIVLPGDLASLRAGNVTLTTPAVASFVVTSAGALGFATQDAGDADLGWLITGKLGAVTVKGDFYAGLTVDNGDNTAAFAPAATTGALTIWGDLAYGYLYSEGLMGLLKIGGDLFGGDQPFSRSISSYGYIPSITIGGNLFGAAGHDSAQISGGLVKVAIGGTIFGGGGERSGSVISYGTVPVSVSVGGNVRGGSATDAGSILSNGPLSKVTVVGSLVGGDTPRDENGDIATDENGPIFIQRAGAIGSFTSIGSVTINGDMFSGQGRFCGSIFTDVAPGAGGNVKSITVLGTVSGSSLVQYDGTNFAYVPTGLRASGQLGAVKVGALAGLNVFNPVQVVALGNFGPATATDALAIGSLTVLRGVTNAEILAGFDATGIALNPDVQIGAIKVGNSFIGSSVSAGVGRAGNGFGDAASAIVATSNGPIVSRIASLTVGGAIVANPFGATDFTAGLVAQEIGALKLGVTALELTKNVLDVFRLGVTNTFFIREVA